MFEGAIAGMCCGLVRRYCVAFHAAVCTVGDQRRRYYTAETPLSEAMRRQTPSQDISRVEQVQRRKSSHKWKR